jgi:hypothetical protein
MSPWLCVCGVWRSFILKNPRHYVRFGILRALKTSLTMTLSKNYQESASVPSLDELMRMQRQRQLQRDSRISAPDNEESGYLSSSSLGSSTTAAPRGSPHASRSMDNLRSILAAAPRGSHRSSARSTDTLRSILHRVVTIIDESDEEPDDSVISSRRDDSNSHP